MMRPWELGLAVLLFFASGQSQCPPAVSLHRTKPTFHPSEDRPDADQLISTESVLRALAGTSAWGGDGKSIWLRDRYLHKLNEKLQLFEPPDSMTEDSVTVTLPEELTVEQVLTFLLAGGSCVIRLERIDPAILAANPIFLGLLQDAPPLSNASLSQTELSERALLDATLHSSSIATAHLYMSGPSGSALPNHGDLGNILVQQLSGAKQWFWWDQSEDYLAMGSLRRQDQRQQTLKAGDRLSLPAGTRHEARAPATSAWSSTGHLDAISLHLTLEWVSIRPLTFFNPDDDPQQIYWFNAAEHPANGTLVGTVKPQSELTVGATIGHYFGWQHPNATNHRPASLGVDTGFHSSGSSFADYQKRRQQAKAWSKVLVTRGMASRVGMTTRTAQDRTEAAAVGCGM